jgi:hypothetical protein
MSHKIFRISTTTNNFGLWQFFAYDPTTYAVYSAATSRRPTFGQVLKDLHTGHYELLNHEFTVAASDRNAFVADATANIAAHLASQQKASLL